jgi:tetratricopeptide (TPR) repeat protein
LLSHSNQCEAAIEQFEKAIELDHKNLATLQNISLCLVALEKYDEAADRLREAMDLVSKDDNDRIAELELDHARIMLSKKDYQAALKFTKAAYQKYLTLDAAEAYIRNLFALRDFKSIVDVVNEKKWFDNFLNLHEIYFEVGCALWSQGQQSLIYPIVTKTLENLEQGGSFATTPWLAAWIAGYMYVSYDDVDACMQLCNRIQSPKFKADLGPELQWAYAYPDGASKQWLGQIYYQKAVDAHRADQDPVEWVDKLKALAIAEAGGPNGQPVYMMNNAAQQLGVYYRKYAKAEESVWKACFRDAIIEALDMLGDEDPLNDVTAYLRLQDLLVAAGDLKNANAAAAVVLTEFFAPSNKETGEALEAIGFKGPFYSCDGLCSPSFTTYKTGYTDLHICTECVDRGFCEECFQLIKKGDMPARLCSQEHEFMQILPVQEEVKGVAAKFDGKTMEVQKIWLNSLRKEWT